MQSRTFRERLERPAIAGKCLQRGMREVVQLATSIPYVLPRIPGNAPCHVHARDDRVVDYDGIVTRPSCIYPQRIDWGTWPTECFNPKGQVIPKQFSWWGNGLKLSDAKQHSALAQECHRHERNSVGRQPCLWKIIKLICICKIEFNSRYKLSFVWILRIYSITCSRRRKRPL